MDLRPGDGDRLAAVLAGVDHREDDLRADRALESPDDLVHGDALGRLAVDLDDPVAGEDAGLIGGRAHQGAEHLKLVAVVGDLDADPAEFALDAGAELVQLLGTDVGGIGVELAQDAVDRRLDQLAAADPPDVVPLDLVQRVHQDLLQLVLVVFVLSLWRRVLSLRRRVLGLRRGSSAFGAGSSAFGARILCFRRSAASRPKRRPSRPSDIAGPSRTSTANTRTEPKRTMQ